MSKSRFLGVLHKFMNFITKIITASSFYEQPKGVNTLYEASNATNKELLYDAIPVVITDLAKAAL